MIAQKLRDMHALAADSCDPEFNLALIEAADEIERLLTALRRIASLAEKNVPKYAQEIAREALNQQLTGSNKP